MDGKNATGRRISLLNEGAALAAATAPTLPSVQYAAKFQLPPLTPHYNSRSSSGPSSPTPQTPNLVRSGSSSSSAHYQSPSPITPSFDSFDSSARTFLRKTSQDHHQFYFADSARSKMDDPSAASMYPPIPDATGAVSSAYPLPPPQMMQGLPQQHQPSHQQLPPMNMQPPHRSSTSPSSEPSRVSTVSAGSNPKPQQQQQNQQQPKKNHYPCPMAKQIGCTDFFTTSGHAARHAKKHTGKKDAFCPECNKAFTRKDNMEQHRRTHQTGRGAARTAVSNDDSKVKKATKPVSMKKADKPDAQYEAAVEQRLVEQQQQQQAQAQAVQVQQMAQQVPLDQGMMMPPSGPYFLNGLPSIDHGPVPSLPMAMPPIGVRPTMQQRPVGYPGSAEYAPPQHAQMVSEEGLHYTYPSPGLSNGLNSLALAASEHRRRSEEESQSRDPSEESQTRGTP